MNSNRISTSRVGKNPGMAWVALALLAAACSAPQLQDAPPDGAALAAKGDWDGAVASYRAALAATSAPEEREAIDKQLQAALAHAISQHLDAGQQAFASHDLAGAESQYQKAAALRADDSRVIAALATTSDVRSRGQTALTAGQRHG